MYSDLGLRERTIDVHTNFLIRIQSSSAITHGLKNLMFLTLKIPTYEVHFLPPRKIHILNMNSNNYSVYKYSSTNFYQLKTCKNNNDGNYFVQFSINIIFARSFLFKKWVRLKFRAALLCTLNSEIRTRIYISVWALCRIKISIFHQLPSNEGGSQRQE